MSKLIVITHTGDEMQIEGKPGRSVMELMRDGSVPDLLALCGGSCSCATCHVWVDQAFMEKFPAAVEDENDLLDSSGHRQPNSRLSCQLMWRDELDGLRVTLAPDD